MGNSADLGGRTCLITGATNGHGEAVAKALARLGADIILLGRSSDKCRRVQSEIGAETGKSPDVLICDLSSLSDIRRTAAEFLAWKRPLHLLVNNAGLVNRYYRESAEGIEETFAVNYLAMYTMTNLLLDRIIESSPARIVNVSSDTHRIADLDLDDMEGRAKRYSLMGAYGRSKLGIVYFTLELARRLEGSGVTVNAVDPGPIASGIAKKPGLLARIADAIIQLTFPKPDRAARTAIYLASSPDVEGLSGTYWRFMKRKDPKVPGGEAFGARLWEITAAMAGIDAGAGKKRLTEESHPIV